MDTLEERVLALESLTRELLRRLGELEDEVGDLALDRRDWP